MYVLILGEGTIKKNLGYERIPGVEEFRVDTVAEGWWVG